MELQEQLRGFTVKRNEIVEHMGSIMELAGEDDRTLDAEEQKEYLELCTK